ncbi:hypothetical protein GCM10027060_06890 [Nesterenkonia halophila]|uniref:DUF4307 domain-containing protein n=1 Tax=Nesterenkonia halophila TaxID=302044 RepID=UPI001478B7D3|nr:DUF4307 domain-containing protein [Nesterenkonia halophila]
MSRAADPAVLAERYGPVRRGPSRRLRTVLISLALVAALGLGIWVAVEGPSSLPESKDVGYDIASDSEASVDFEVTKEFDSTVRCLVQVLDDSYAVVGATTVTLGPHTGDDVSERTQSFTADLRTERRGVTGLVESCWTVEA